MCVRALVYVLICLRMCVRACVGVVSRANRVFPRVRMRMRKWAEGVKGRPARFLWQQGMSGMSSTCK